MDVRRISFAMLLLTASSFVSSAGVAAQTNVQTGQRWETSARLLHRLASTRGTIEIGNRGVVFRAAKGKSLDWSFANIQNFFITQHTLRLRSYENRGWRLPGDKVYRFELSRAVPPEVAAALAGGVGKPSQNGDPNPHAPAFATIPARHGTLTGGSNGMLRFNRRGIDYVTSMARDSRSWRWVDIETIAKPSDYQFTVGGYRETYQFKLKQPMTEALFDQLWDSIYGKGLRLSARP